MFQCESLERLLLPSWTSKGALPCPEKNLNDGVTWIVELGNLIEWQVDESRDTTRELWYVEKTKSGGLSWVGTQIPQQCRYNSCYPFRKLELLGKMASSELPT